MRRKSSPVGVRANRPRRRTRIEFTCGPVGAVLIVITIAIVIAMVLSTR